MNLSDPTGLDPSLLDNPGGMDWSWVRDYINAHGLGQCRAAWDHAKGWLLGLPDAAHPALDYGGVFDPTPTCDLVNAGIYTWQGQFGDAGISVLGLVPLVGDTAKVGRCAAKEGVPAALKAARGGVYGLFDRKTGEIVRTGQTCDLARRRGEHALDPILGQYEFTPFWRTDDYAARRGLEQYAHDLHKPALNKIRPISPRNPYLPVYTDAASRYLP